MSPKQFCHLEKSLSGNKPILTCGGYRMKKIALATTVAVSMLLATSLQANQADKGKGIKACDQSPKMMRAAKKSCNMVDNLWKLDLTPKQTEQLLDILIKNHSEEPNIADAFTKEYFDKAKFSQIMKQKREARIDRQAAIISEAYPILTIEQREVFVESLNKNKKQCNTKGKQGDKGCNGRR